jgi:hypothetical protein
MKRAVLWSLPLAIVLGPWSAALAQSALPVDSLDCLLTDSPDRAHPDAWQDYLGPPDSIVKHPRDVAPDDTPSFVDWHYPDLVLALRYGVYILSIRLTGPTHATRRGLRVGDTRERVRALYGDPGGISNSRWEYLWTPEQRAFHFCRVLIDMRNDTVERILLITASAE